MVNVVYTSFRPLVAIFILASPLLASQEEVLEAALTQEPDSEKLLWSFELKAPSYGSGAAADIDGDGKPEIVFGTYYNDEHVYALNGEDGSLLWKFKSEGGPVDTSILLHDLTGDGRPEVVFGDSASGTLFCLKGDGEVLWKFAGQSGTDSPPAAADLDGDGKVEVVYGTMKKGGKDGFVNVLDGATGNPIWSVEMPGHIQSEPGLADLNGDKVLDVLVANWMGDGKLRALSGKDGEELWSFETNDSVYHGVSIADFDKDKKPEVAIADRNGNVWLLEGESGELVWQTELKDEHKGAVFAPTNLVKQSGNKVPWIVVCGQHLHLIDGRKGEVKWRNDYGKGSIQRGVAIADIDGNRKPDLAFVVGTRLYVVRAEDGKELWSEEMRVGEGIYEGGGAPLILDLDGDGHLDIFLVMGRGLSDDTRLQNYGRAIALRAGKGKPDKGNQWLTFRGGPQRIGTPSD
jgi:outer membrane protein assembly factor BamB|tara:strand:- start:123 stop:1505 length:1383 start_codon:yes stop_codon:yes gene_type:complete